MIATYTFPNILLSSSLENGLITHQVREGALKQIERKTNVEEHDEEPERPEIFRTQATNRINFAGATIDVINDALELGNLTLPASKPSKSEYLALIGQEVLIAWRAVQDPKTGKWKSYRTTIVLQ